MDLELTTVERDLLLELLRDHLGDLKAEINRTETRDFKDQLKAREASLMAIIGRLEAAPE